MARPRSDPIGAAERLVRDRVGPGTGGCFGDHRVGAALQQGVDRPLVVGGVERAVGAGGELGDLAHHPLLVLLGLGTGRIVLKHDLGGLIRVGLGVLPALHGGADEAHHLVDERRVGQLVFKDVKAVLKRGDTLCLVGEDHQLVGGEARVDDLPILVVGHGGDAVGLLLQDWIDVEALLQHRNAAAPLSGCRAGTSRRGTDTRCRRTRRPGSCP